VPRQKSGGDRESFVVSGMAYYPVSEDDLPEGAIINSAPQYLVSGLQAQNDTKSVKNLINKASLRRNGHVRDSSQNNDMKLTHIVKQLKQDHREFRKCMRNF
jgi:hypothetical protein